MDGRDPVGRTKVRLEKSVEAAERTRAWWGPSPAEERVWGRTETRQWTEETQKNRSKCNRPVAGN